MKTRNWLLLFCLLFLVKITLLGVVPLTDPSEGRYAGIALNMVKTGNDLMPQVWQDGKIIPFMGKPVLGFWLMAAGIKLFGSNEFAVRLPGFLAGAMLLGILFFVLQRYESKRIAWTAMLITGSCFSFYLLSGMVLVDPVLTLFAIGAVFWYYAFLRETSSRKRTGFSLLVFVFLGFGFLTKGPVALVYFGMPAFFWTLWNHQWRTLRHHAWISGLTLFLLISVPWFIVAEQHYPGFLKYFFVNENFMRYYANQYGDLYGDGRKLPYGTALFLSFACFLPWSGIMLYLGWPPKGRFPGIRQIPARTWTWLKSNVRDEQMGGSLFFSGMLFTTLFWCMARQLVAYYLISLVPLFAVWCARFLAQKKVPLRRIAKLCCALIIGYTILSVAISPWLSRAKSTRAVIARVCAGDLTQDKPNASIIFVHRMPFSAYFYARDRVVPHGKEPTATSIERAIKEGKNSILICKKRYISRIPEKWQHAIKIQDRVGHLTILKVTKNPIPTPPPEHSIRIMNNRKR